MDEENWAKKGERRDELFTYPRGIFDETMFVFIKELYRVRKRVASILPDYNDAGQKRERS